MRAAAPIPDPCAAAGDEGMRVRQAARASTRPEVLQALARDPSVTVRAAVALNPASAPEADRCLATDGDERVRILLAGKVARLLPGLSGDDHAAAQHHAHQTLLTLAEDAAVKVRLAVAEVLNAMPEAPRAVILRLAHDPVLAVSDPVVRFSPLLTDADLLELLATPPHAGMAEAVASRPQLSSRIAEAIGLHADTKAVRVLLANPSAMIQESTLDALIGRAGEHPDWHEPLVQRPCLSERAVRALSQIVAAHLVEVLSKRPDVPAALADELRDRLADRFSDRDRALPQESRAQDSRALDGVTALKAGAALNENALLEAAAAGDHRKVAAILAAGAGVTLGVLDRAISLRNAKALVSLVWRAGFSMRAGTAVQVLLGRLSPDETLAAGVMGQFPLSPQEMEFQVELLTESAR